MRSHDDDDAHIWKGHTNYVDRLQAVAEMCLFILIFEVIQKKKMLTVVKYNGRLLYLSTWTKINTLK